MKGEPVHSNYRIFPGTLLSAFFSLFSGASVGPEGPIAILVMEISAWFREKLKIINEASVGFDVAALASAYNGIIGSPFFAAVLATEFNIGNKNALKFVAWNLLAGVIGFLFYSLLGLHSFASFLSFPPIGMMTLSYILWAVALGILGAFIAIGIGLAMKGIGDAVEKVFDGRIMTRILCAGVIIGVICYILPELLFSGETTIQSIIANPAQYGILLLLGMAVLKILLLALSFKSGYLGGPIFPTLFACTMVGLALNLAFPGVPVAILVLCLEVAVVTLALGVPLTAILLIGVIGVADTNMYSLLVISSVISLMLGMVLRDIREKRAKNHPAIAS
jgi:H+/Cl- antiporter ClcA